MRYNSNVMCITKYNQSEPLQKSESVWIGFLINVSQVDILQTSLKKSYWHQLSKCMAQN